MNELKDLEPLDMTSDEAIKFLFPNEAIDQMKKVANPEKPKVRLDENDCDEKPYTDSRI